MYGLAGDRELAEAGLSAGSLSPIGLPPGLRLVVDDAVARSGNLVFGANQAGFHFRNGNFGRDFQSPDVADISLTRVSASACSAAGPWRRSRRWKWDTSSSWGTTTPAR